MAGIYIHIPFCKKACHYCNFHFSTSLKYKTDMVRAISKEIALQKHYLNTKDLQSIYFGGGTPSLLEKDDLGQIFSSISQHFNFNSDTEITLEANPDDLTKEKLYALAKTPINRLSIGIQSFDDGDLLFFNRAHNSKEAINSINYAISEGFNNITADLIYGSPSSSVSKIIKNVSMLLDLGITHISAYALTVEEKTALHHFVQKGKVQAPSEIEASNQYDLIIDLLKENEFLHYEISNFAKDGHLAVHNTNYWKDIPYLGIGPSAHSFDGKTRQWNISHNPKYLQAIKENKIPAEKETLTTEEKYNEYVMTSLRTMWGCDEKRLLYFGQEYLQYFKDNVVLLNTEWISKSGSCWILSQKGNHFADGIAMKLFF